MRRIAVSLSLVTMLVTSGLTTAAQAPPPPQTATAKPLVEDIGFPSVPGWSINVPDLSDAQVDDLLATLDRLVAQEKDPAKWASSAGIHFWRFQNRFERGRTTDAQRATVAARFDRIAAAHPAEKAFVDRRKWMAVSLGVGRPVPNITGKDFDGVTFSLSEYLGKVIYLVFTGEWCGPCRSEYPYQRLMLELYKDRPFAILGVNSDEKLETARQGKIDNRLPGRSWWDGHEKESTKGPIATAWGVTGWPTIYVIDAKGTIRFAGVRHEDSLKAVAQLMSEIPRTAK